VTVHQEGGDEGSSAGSGDDVAGPVGASRPWLVAAAVVLGVTAVLVPVRVVFKQLHKPEAQPGTVTIANYDFGPSPLAISAGAKVRIVNDDSVAHTATADDKSFDTDVLKAGQSVEVVVQKTVTYHCDIHPTMRATIEVGG
jgi:plastocyanin